MFTNKQTQLKQTQRKRNVYIYIYKVLTAYCRSGRYEKRMVSLVKEERVKDNIEKQD
jgi:hypothetical protein